LCSAVARYWDSRGGPPHLHAHYPPPHDYYRGGPPPPPWHHPPFPPPPPGNDRRNQQREGNDKKTNGNRDERTGERIRRDEGPPGVSLLIRNVAPDITTEDLQTAFGRIGELRDVYIPRDYHSQQPKGFAFIEYATAALASEAREEMDRFVIKGRPLEVVFAQERRKTPNEMRGRVVNQLNAGSETASPGPPAAADHKEEASRPRSNSASKDRYERSSSFERHLQRQREGGKPK
jgi:FUS-interacting serine-arginine-rich protein 1